jgi:hypothetical protein
MKKRKIEYNTKEWVKTEECNTENWRKRVNEKESIKWSLKGSIQAMHDQTATAVKVTMQIAKCAACQQNVGMDGSQPAMILMSMLVSMYREESYVTSLPERLHKCFPNFSLCYGSKDFFFI